MKKLDYEKKKDYEFTVTAYNTEPVVSASSSSLHARVQVRVFIENVDEPPEFKQKKTVLFIDENQPSGTKILNSANLAVDPEDDPFRWLFNWPQLTSNNLLNLTLLTLKLLILLLLNFRKIKRVF